jgi:hypothetical protein
MGEYFRTVMNRKTLDKLLGRERSFFSSFYRAPEMVDPALEECEAAITPLLDHLEHNLKTLNDNLTESNMQLIIIRVWKEILMTLEGILLPPLSEQLSELKPLDDIEFQVVYKWLDVSLFITSCSLPFIDI